MFYILVTQILEKRSISYEHVFSSYFMKTIFSFFARATGIYSLQNRSESFFRSFLIIAYQ